MGFEYEMGQPYLMPGHFGPVSMGWDGTVAHYEDNTALSILYVTERKAVEDILPPRFVVTDPPIVSVTFSMCRGVDFMAGGGYNLVTVDVTARYEGRRDTAEGTFCLVYWGNKFYPVVLGREVMGIPKIHANVPDGWMRDGRRGFMVSENGSLLLEGEAWELSKLSDEELQALAKQNRGRVWMGWKYVPSCDFQKPDVSHATALPANRNLKEAWKGQGKIIFHEVAWEKTLLSCRVINALRKLPVLHYQGAIMTRGSLDLLIHEQHAME